MLYYFCLNSLYSQQLVTLNRERLNKEQTRRKNENRRLIAAQKEKRDAEAKKKQKRYKPVEKRIQEATFLMVNNHYSYIGMAVSNYFSNETFTVKTDGSDYSVLDVPSWCNVTTKTPSFFTLSINSNDGYDERTGCFYVKSDNRSCKVSVVQPGKPIIIAAYYTKSDVTHNVEIAGQKYMSVDAMVRINGAKGLKMRAVAVVVDKFGQRIKSNNIKNAFNDGTFFVSYPFLPYSDEYGNYKVSLMIPNNDLMLTDKNMELSCELLVYCENNNDYVSNAGHSFKFVAKNKKGKIITKAK